MLVLVKTPLRWSPDGITVRAAAADDILDLPRAIADGLIASGHVVPAPEAGARPAKARRATRSPA